MNITFAVSFLGPYQSIFHFLVQLIPCSNVPVVDVSTRAIKYNKFFCIWIDTYPARRRHYAQTRWS